MEEAGFNLPIQVNQLVALAVGFRLQNKFLIPDSTKESLLCSSILGIEVSLVSYWYNTVELVGRFFETENLDQ